MGAALSMHGKVVLIVEDDPSTAAALADIIRLAGHEPVVAENGQKALDILNAGEVEICLVVLDLMMPVMDGWELRKRMVADPRLASLPVIVVTADANARKRAEQAQAVQFLTKPIEPSVLLETIDQHC